MVLDDLRRRWVRAARAAGRLGEAAALEADDVSAPEAMSRIGDMSLSAARASQAIEQLHREREAPIGSPWRRS